MTTKRKMMIPWLRMRSLFFLRIILIFAGIWSFLKERIFSQILSSSVKMIVRSDVLTQFLMGSLCSSRGVTRIPIVSLVVLIKTLSNSRATGTPGGLSWSLHWIAKILSPLNAIISIPPSPPPWVILRIIMINKSKLNNFKLYTYCVLKQTIPSFFNVQMIWFSKRSPFLTVDGFLLEDAINFLKKFFLLFIYV